MTDEDWRPNPAMQWFGFATELNALYDEIAGDEDHQPPDERTTAVAAWTALTRLACSLAESNDEPANLGRGWIMFDAAMERYVEFFHQGRPSISLELFTAQAYVRVGLVVADATHRPMSAIRKRALAVLEASRRPPTYEPPVQLPQDDRGLPVDDIEAIAEGRMTPEEVARRWLNDPHV